MSSFLDRIRARTRRANAKRAKRQGVASVQALGRPAFAPLGLDDGQGEAIRNALQPELANAPEVVAAIAALTELEGIASDEASEASTRADESLTTDIVEDLPQPTTAGPTENMAPEPVDAVGGHPDILKRLEFPKSSNVRAATLGSHGVVAVEFANGTTYQYANFTLELMIEWQDAKSAGSWFHQHVRTKPDRHPVVQAG